MKFTQRCYMMWKWYSAHREVGLTVSWDEFRRIKQRYEEPNRFYHNFTHIYKMLKYLDSRSMATAPAVFATFYHDVFYVAGDPNNERTSADLWKDYIGRKTVRAAFCDLEYRVEKYIMATKSHVPLNTGWEELIFLDADMIILASPLDEYKVYAEAVRMEFMTVLGDFAGNQNEFNKGRLAFLKHLLKPEVTVFNTRVGTEKLLQLDENLKWEINDLENRISKYQRMPSATF